ncbi:hypothetical protein FQA39_LY13747 [Lamprigera yunnana]|nr:hypothetical protein FQA39_LY13747 [Lamprigera yunnana]
MESVDNPVPDYYWKEFNGVIPKDALPCGLNSNGTTTYVGQVYHGNLVTPVKIDIDTDVISYEWGYKEYTVNENIKILCGKHVEQFQWLNTANRLIHTLKDKHLIIGGYEEGGNIYIGRIQLDDELSVGKIVDGPNQSTLNTVKNGTGYQHAAFQILSYNPDITPRPVNTRCRGRPIVINFFSDP